MVWGARGAEGDYDRCRRGIPRHRQVQLGFNSSLFSFLVMLAPGDLKAAVPFLCLLPDGKVWQLGWGCVRNTAFATFEARVRGAGHRHVWIYEWPAASASRVPGLCAPARGSGAALGAGSCSQVPAPPSPVAFHCRAGRVPSLASTPWGGESRGLPLRQAGAPAERSVSSTGGSVWEVFRRDGTFRGEPRFEEVVSSVRLCLVLRNLRGQSGSAPGRRIRQIPVGSLRSGAGGEWVGARLKESDQDFAIERSGSET